MRQMRLTIGIVLVITGAIWLLQGLDIAFAPQSFMSGDRTWVAAGAVAVVVGGALIWTSRSR